MKGIGDYHNSINLTSPLKKNKEVISEIIGRKCGKLKSWNISIQDRIENIKMKSSMSPNKKNKKLVDWEISNLNNKKIVKNMLMDSSSKNIVDAPSKKDIPEEKYMHLLDEVSDDVVTEKDEWLDDIEHMLKDIKMESMKKEVNNIYKNSKDVEKTDRKQLNDLVNRLDSSINNDKMYDVMINKLEKNLSKKCSAAEKKNMVNLLNAAMLRRGTIDIDQIDLSSNTKRKHFSAALKVIDYRVSRNN